MVLALLTGVKLWPGSWRVLQGMAVAFAVWGWTKRGFVCAPGTLPHPRSAAPVRTRGLAMLWNDASLNFTLTMEQLLLLCLVTRLLDAS